MGIVGTTMIQTLRYGASPVLLLRSGVKVFSYDGSKIFVGEVEAIGERVFSRILRVLFDSGHSIRVTEDQVFRRFTGERVLARDLEPGTSLLPLYLKENPNGYVEFQQLRSDREGAAELTDRRLFRKVSRMVGEFKLGHRLKARTYCRHLDRDRTNCCPENIIVEETPTEEATRRRNLSVWVQDIKDTQDFLKGHASLARPIRFKMPKNHKVEAVVECGQDETVELHLVGNLPFAVGNEEGGVFLG